MRRVVTTLRASRLRLSSHASQTSVINSRSRPNNAARGACHHEFSTSFKKSVEIRDPTIYALSTAPGRAAIAVIRVSGSECVKVNGPKHGLSHGFLVMVSL